MSEWLPNLSVSNGVLLLCSIGTSYTIWTTYHLSKRVCGLEESVSSEDKSK